MQFSAVVLAFAAAVSATQGPGLISISNLRISSIYAEHAASYHANVSYTGDTGYSTLSIASNSFSDVCRAADTYVYAPSIDGFNSQSFDNQAFTWALIKNPGDLNGYVLNVNYTSGGEVYQGSRAIPASDFFCSGQSDIHGQDAQTYDGPADFTLAVTEN